MAIEVRDDWYYGCFFFVDGKLPGGEQHLDIMGTLYKESKTDDPDVPWKLVWRFRYYLDSNCHGSKDEKKWYSGTVGTGKSTEEAYSGLETWIGTVSKVMHDVNNKVIMKIEGNGKVFYEKALKDKPWAHQRSAPEGAEPGEAGGEFFTNLKEKGTEGSSDAPLCVNWMQ